jgi:hypothetical protein
MRRNRWIDLTKLRPVPGALHGLGAVPTGGPPPQFIPRPDDFAPRDWAVFLLRVAAEIEQALMIQYLYAAYSLKPGLPIPGVPNTTTTNWSRTIVQIAREEMGHLLSVQNLLRLIGGPMCFEREDFPLRSQFYPFPFFLERLTKNSLSKYLFTEMNPADIPAVILPPAERTEIEMRARAAVGAAGGTFINHVGTLFNTLTVVFTSELKAADFRTDRNDYQSRQWQGTDETPTNIKGVKLLQATTQAEALTSLSVIALQGEAADPNNPPPPPGSHFQRFLEIYRKFPEDASTLTWPVLTNPTTAADADANANRITDVNTQRWASLFNLRYRILLMELVHVTAIAAADNGLTQTPLRQLVHDWIFGEMHDGPAPLRDLAMKLAQMPSGTADSTCGAPFEMPYSLSLPDHGPERWRLHRDLIDASSNMIALIRKNSGNDPLLDGIVTRDGATDADGRRKDIADNQNSPE